MSPHWVPPYKARRSTHQLSFAVQQNHMLLETGGEACSLLKRLRRVNDTFQSDARRVDPITSTLNSFTIDPDTGMWRAKVWGASTDDVDKYPDILALTCTVQASGSTEIWEPTSDKYSFIDDANEFAFDIFQNQLDSGGDSIEDSVYIIFNTPPFDSSFVVHLTYGNINPAVCFEYMQPRIDNENLFQRSLFSFEQWLESSSRIRTRAAPNRFLVAFPGVLTDITLTAGGFLRQSNADFWTNPPPYSPTIVEHDVVVRESTGQRYQLVNYTPIYVEDILVSQHFDMSELDPRSSVYDIEVV